MMRMLELNIETDDFKLPASFFDGRSISFGDWHDGPEGVRFLLRPPLMRRSGDMAPIVLGAVLSVPAGVAAAVIAHWLTERLRGRSRRVTINRTVITRITKDELERVVHESIEREE